MKKTVMMIIILFVCSGGEVCRMLFAEERMIAEMDKFQKIDRVCAVYICNRTENVNLCLEKCHFERWDKLWIEDHK